MLFKIHHPSSESQQTLTVERRPPVAVPPEGQMEPDPAADVQQRETYHILPDDLPLKIEIRSDFRRQDRGVRSDIFQFFVDFGFMWQTTAAGQGFLELLWIEGGILCGEFFAEFG